MDELQQTLKGLKEDIKRYDEILKDKPPKRTKEIILALIILLPIVIILVVVNPSFTGLFSKGDYVVVEQKESIIVNNSSNFTIKVLGYEKAEINGIKLSGKVVGDGRFSIYLIDKGKKLLVIDSSHLSKGAPEITGRGISQDNLNSETTIKNENYSENITAENKVDLSDNEKDNTTLEDSGLREDILEETSKDGENITSFNETINETSGTEDNTSDINTEENVSYEVNMTELIFDKECVETCSLLNIKNDTIELEIELSNVTLEITKTIFIIKKELNLTQVPPMLIDELPNLTIMQGESAVVNLENYFYDENNDILNYSISQLENISTSIDGSILTFTPYENYLGTQEYFVSASDLNFTTYSNKATITVVEGNLTNATNITETLLQMPAIVGKPVKWVKRIDVDGKGKRKIKTTLPKEAQNIVVKKNTIPLDKNKVIVNERYKLTDYELDRGEELKDISFIDTIVYYENFTIEYETPAPELIEESKDGLSKIVHIYSNIDYSNVTVVVNITEVPREAIDVYWLLNDTDYESYTGVKPQGEGPYKLNVEDYEFLELKYIDYDSNNKVDALSWIIPHMSNQTFEISISILNVYSKPIVGGLWEIYFNTTGEADLTITATNETTFTEVEEDNPETNDDLEILKLYCGETPIYDKELKIYNDLTYFILNDSSMIKVGDAQGESLRESSISHKNYTCNYTGRFIVKVITPGVHDLEFDFGGIKAYAHNDANSPPTLESIVLNSTSSMNMTSGNLTAYPLNVTDSDNDSVFINYNWKVNGSSITILNMPFTNAEYNSSGNQTTYDFSGNSLHGTLGGPTTGDLNEPSFRNSTQCVYDGCYYFNSIDYIKIPDDSRMAANNYYTLEFWIKPNVSTGTSFILFYDYRTILSNKYGFIISYSYSTSSLWIYTYNGINSDTLIVSSITNNQWNHVAIVFNCSGYCDTGENTTVYINGVKKKDDLLDAPAYSDSDLYIGANSTGGSGFIGWIDEVRYYNRTLSEEQIIANYNEGAARYNITVGEELSDEDVWQVIGCPVDGRGLNGTCKSSNNITTIWNHEPTQSNPVLNSTYGTNYTNENLTCYNISTSDIDGDNVTNIITWKVNDTNQLLMYFPFDTEYERTTTSAIRNYANSSMNATLGSGNPTKVPKWLNYSNCKRGGCYNFINTGNYSTNDYIIVQNSNSLNFTNRSFSVECWLKTNTSNGTVPGDFNRGYCISSFNSSNYNEWALRVANGTPTFGYRDNLYNICAPTVGNPGQYADNQWHYYVGVRNWEEKRILLYVDGVLAANVTDNCTGVIDTRNPVYIGVGEFYDDPDNYLNGSIDEVAVWKRVLTSEEIATRYNLNYNVIVSQETRKGETWSCEMTPNDAKEDGTTLSSNTLKVNNAPPTQGTPILNTSSNLNTTNENLTVYVQNASDLDNDLIKYAFDWRKDNISIASALFDFDVNHTPENKTRDLSTYGNNGTVNISWYSNIGFNNSGAYNFTGTGGIYLGNKPEFNFSNSFTIALWIKVSTWDTAYQSVIAKGDAYKLERCGLTNKISINITGSTNLSLCSSSDLNDNNWHYVVATYNTTNLSLYVDGILQNSSPYTGTISKNNYDLAIGDNTQFSGRNFKGVIDNVLVMNTSITQNQVQAFYQNKTYIIVSDMIMLYDTWSSCVTLNDGENYGLTKCSNEVTFTKPSVTNCSYGCLYIRNSSNSNKMIFDKLGNVDVAGDIFLNDVGTPNGNDFIIKDSTGDIVAWLDDVTGNLRLMGSVTQNLGSYCAPEESSFVIKDNSGNCVAYIDKKGNLWAKGRVKENAEIK